MKATPMPFSLPFALRLLLMMGVLTVLPACHVWTGQQSLSHTQRQGFRPRREQPQELPYHGTFDKRAWVSPTASAEERCAGMQTLVDEFYLAHIPKPHKDAVALTLKPCREGEEGRLELPFTFSRDGEQLAFLARVAFSQKPASDGTESQMAQGEVFAYQGGRTSPWPRPQEPSARWQPILHSKLMHTAKTLSAWLSHEEKTYSAEACHALGRLFLSAEERCQNAGQADANLLRRAPKLESLALTGDGLKAVQGFVREAAALAQRPLAAGHGLNDFSGLVLHEGPLPRQIKKAATRQAGAELWFSEWQQDWAVPGGEGRLRLKLSFAWLVDRKSERPRNVSLVLMREASPGQWEAFDPEAQVQQPILHPALLDYRKTLQAWVEAGSQASLARTKAAEASRQAPPQAAEAGKPNLPPSLSNKDRSSSRGSQSNALEQFLDFHSRNNVEHAQLPGVDLYRLVVRACHQGAWQDGRDECRGWYSALQGKEIRQSNFRRVAFDHMTLADINWDEVKLQETSWRGTMFHGPVVFEAGSELAGAHFASDDLSQVVFATGCSLRNVTFEGRLFPPGEGSADKLAKIFGQASDLDKANFKLSAEEAPVLEALQKLLAAAKE